MSCADTDGGGARGAKGGGQSARTNSGGGSCGGKRNSSLLCVVQAGASREGIENEGLEPRGPQAKLPRPSGEIAALALSSCSPVDPRIGPDAPHTQDPRSDGKSLKW